MRIAALDVERQVQIPIVYEGIEIQKFLDPSLCAMFKPGPLQPSRSACFCVEAFRTGEEWNDGVMERKNKNRGYQRLRVWEDAVALYVETCQRFRSMPFEMKRIAGVQTVGIDY